MSELLPRSSAAGGDEPLLDTLLREAVPEIKLSLGDLIDRDNTRAIPDRYTKLLPQATLILTLRPDAADAVRPIAAELEEELTDSVMRHGSLYDREYRVKIKEAAAPGAPLFRVSLFKGDDAGLSLSEMPPPPPPSPTPVPEPSSATVAAPPPPRAPERVAPPPVSEPTVAAPAEIRIEPSRPASPPVDDPDATRVDGVAPPKRWDEGRFTLVVEDEEGAETERFPIPGPLTTVGRQTDDAELKSDVVLTGAKNVSRRQLALLWAPRGDNPGFTVYNLGLNDLHVGDADVRVRGANRGRGPLKLEELMLEHTEWVSPGTVLRVGEHGPRLRIVDTAAGAEDEGDDEPEDEVPVDPDATQFG
jgi:hypothetical protein